MGYILWHILYSWPLQRGRFFRVLSRRIFLGRQSGHLLMHRHGAVVSAFFVCLSGILFISRLDASASDPRRGGQRERVTITNVIVRICESLPISPTPHNGITQAWFRIPLRRDITADREWLQPYSRCSVIEKHPDSSPTIMGQTLAVSGNS